MTSDGAGCRGCFDERDDGCGTPGFGERVCSMSGIVRAFIAAALGAAVVACTAGSGVAQITLRHGMTSACEAVTAAEVQAAFGGTVGAGTSQAGSDGASSCAFRV